MSVHPLAVVDPAAVVHPEAIVGPFCVVGPSVTLEAGVELRSHATVVGRTRIGEGTIVFPGAVIGGDPQDLKFRGEDSEVIVGRRCRIHECATINKGTEGGGMRTVIGDGCLLMAYAHVAHDCELADQVIVGNGTQLAGHIKVGRRAVIGGMVGLHHYATIGELAIVGSMSGVRFDIPPFTMADGNPAEARAINVIGLRRDGWSEDEIQALRDAFRAIWHGREGSLKERAERVAASPPEVGRERVLTLVRWLLHYLETEVKGRVQESRRPPVIGGRPGA